MMNARAYAGERDMTTKSKGSEAKTTPRRRVREKPPSVQWIARAEGWQILEEQAQLNLGLSAAEFIRKWDAGEFENPDTPAIISVYMLLPLVR